MARKIRTRTCVWCEKEYQTRLKTECCGYECSNRKTAEERKLSGESKVIANKSAKTMHDNGWYGSKEHLKAVQLMWECDNVARGRAISKGLLKDGVAAKGALKQMKTKVEKGIYIDPALKSEWTRYKATVLNITAKQDVESIEHYEKRGRAGIVGAYHLDHKYSIAEGFKQNVAPEIIGDIKNLEFITWEENLSKKDKCSVSLNCLTSHSECL